MIEELKKEETKYRKLYDEGIFLDGVKADSFKIAIISLNQRESKKPINISNQ